MKEISDRSDIESLVDKFYKKVVLDETIGYFFTEVMVLDWDKHKPVMYDFWETLLFGMAKYKGNPMLKHIDLNKKEHITSSHFERWLQLWEETLNENFHGEVADTAKKKAHQIAGLMKLKIEGSDHFRDSISS